MRLKIKFKKIKLIQRFLWVYENFFDKTCYVSWLNYCYNITNYLRTQSYFRIHDFKNPITRHILLKNQSNTHQQRSKICSDSSDKNGTTFFELSLSLIDNLTFCLIGRRHWTWLHHVLRLWRFAKLFKLGANSSRQHWRATASRHYNGERKCTII